jgi:hypothetical protein
MVFLLSRLEPAAKADLELVQSLEINALIEKTAFERGGLARKIQAAVTSTRGNGDGSPRLAHPLFSSTRASQNQLANLFRRC